ncbi:pilus assembly protein CpaF [Salirhabdus euzebyi]|uniref:Pilus assembly protein CpaF n=1 Tax=Salirhabdus euzebyi TaxID=394506 RepID=A0A841Q4K6_9BACI|nr:CpaF family protein [Salirhabdus euzebyi]MBB6453325.1 pilus assembly protein CpaF [Salirhabdus euzebyi]
MSLLKRLGNNDPLIDKPQSSTKILKTYQPQKRTGNDLESRLHNYVIEEIQKKNQNEENIDQKIYELAESFLDEQSVAVSFEEKRELVGAVKNELVGFGPITPLLHDPAVTEIMVNGPNDVYVEKKGKLIKTDVQFKDNGHITRIIEKIVTPLGRRIDESSPMVDARLPDGSRVNAIIPPLAINGPTITIRKFSETPFTIQDFIRFGTLTDEMAEFLKACVSSKLNILVSGNTGSGKTSMLNVLSSFIPSDERIVTIEDAAELQLSQPHLVTLESRPPNIEGEGEITIRDLVRNALRMRPDRIIVGEVRSSEALDMLQAMNTGHDGSLSTGHANSPRDLLSRLETMVLMAGFDLPVKAIREQIAGAVDLIIHQSRLKDGTRKVTHITEVLGLEGDIVVLQDLFLFKETGVGYDGHVLGRFSPTGIRPKFADLLESKGIKLSSALFQGEW